MTPAEQLALALREFLTAYDKQQSERSLHAGSMAVLALASCRDALAQHEAQQAQAAERERCVTLCESVGQIGPEHSAVTQKCIKAILEGYPKDNP